MADNKKVNSLLMGESGAALITSLFLITIMTVLGMLVLNTSVVEIKMAANQKSAAQVFYAAEAGLERGLQVLVKDMEDDATSGAPWGNLSFPASAGSVSAAYVNGATVFDPDVRSLDMYIDANAASGVRKLTFANGGTSLGNSTYDIYMYSPNNFEVYLLAYASGPQGAAALEYHLNTDDMSPYNNAVFSGTGINGKVTGNVNISGSVYSLGEMYFQGDVSLTNNYTDGGIDSVLEAMLPTNTDLDSKIRVKGGDLTLKGSAQIGTGSANPKGSAASVQVDLDFSSQSTVYADQTGSDVPNIPMPGILDGLEEEFSGVSSNAAYSGIGDDTERTMTIYQDLIKGTGPFAPGQTYADPGAAITSRGVVIDFPVWDCDGEDEHGGGEWETGELEIQDCTASFSYLDSLGNGITYDATNRIITVTGMVYIDEEFEIEHLPGVTYVSKGAFSSDSAGTPVAPPNQNEQAAMIIAGEEIEIDTSFVPDNGGYLQGGDYTNSIGFLAGEEIEIEGNPGDLVTGFFFTPGEFEIEHQVQIAGTLIGGEFEFEQVPDVFQVPALKNYLPRYMPGTQTTVAFKTREWRRIY